jgi:phosphoserine phosphatase RsbU/P
VNHVLICDDLPDIVLSLKLLLKTAGYKVSTANSAASCLGLAARGDVDLVLTDMNFDVDTTSGIEGLDLVKQLVELSEAPPVIVMTGYAGVALAVKAMQQGALDFVEKPWDNSALLATIQNALQQHQRQQAENSLARQVQRKLLSEKEVAGDGWQVRAQFQPAKAVGGDYYDVFPLPQGVAIVVADVSGKGIPAALLMANLQASLRAQPTSLLASPGELIHTLNRLFYGSTRPEHYATLFYGVFDRTQRTFTYVNCGHPSANLIGLGPQRELESTGFPLGMFAEWRGSEAEVHIPAGETLYCVTDGITEADLVEDDRTELWLTV